MVAQSPESRVDGEAPTEFATLGADARGGRSSAAMAAQFAGLREVIDPAPNLTTNARYVFGGVFAHGGLGQIRRAFDRVLGRTIAVKEMLATSGHQRFMREAQVTAQLDHPAVVPVHDLGVHADGRPFYCMKLIDGSSLEAVIAAAPTLHQRILLLPNIITVAEAVAFAHSKGILHRDLKPANILVGNFGETWIIDWGLAGYIATPEGDIIDATQSDVERSHLTRTGEWIGTLPYMPPEQRCGQHVDERADVYGLGAVLYHTLSGRRPYADTPDRLLVEHVVTNPPTDLGHLVPDVPPDLLAIVRKAMARDPAARYPDARALADDLRRFLAGRLVAAHTYGFSDVVRRWVHRHRAVLVVAALGLVALGIAGLYSVRRISVERDAAVRNQHAAESARDEAERRGDEARKALASMWEATGRRELIDNLRPLDARDPLARAVELAPDRSHLRTMLAEAERPLRTIVCEGSRRRADQVFLHPYQPQIVFGGPFPTVGVWSADDCSQMTEISTDFPNIQEHGVGFTQDGSELWILGHFELEQYDLVSNTKRSGTPIQYGALDARFGKYAEYVSVMGFQKGGTFLLHSLGPGSIHKLEIPGMRFEVSSMGSTIAWIDRGRLITRRLDGGEHELSRKIGDETSLLDVSDHGDVLLASNGRFDILREDNSRTPLQSCGEPVKDNDRGARSGSFHPWRPFVLIKDRRGELRVWRSDTGFCVGAVTDRDVVKWVAADIAGISHVLTLDSDGRVSLWRMTSEAGLERVVTLDVHDTGAFDFDVQKSSGRMITLGRDGAFRVWDLTAFVPATAVLRAARISLRRDGTAAAVADAHDVRLVNPLNPGDILATWPIPQLETLRWNEEGKLLARRGTWLLDWDPANASSPHELEAGEDFDPDSLEHELIAGSSLVVVRGLLRSQAGRAAYLPEIRIYDTKRQEWQRIEMGGNSHAPTVVTSKVATGRSRALILDTGIIVDTDTGAKVYTVAPSAVMTPRGDDILATDHAFIRHDVNGSRVQYIDYNVSRPHRRRGGVRDAFSADEEDLPEPRAAVFSPAGDVFAGLGTGPEVTLWGHPDFSRRTFLVGHRQPVYDAHWSVDGARLLTRGTDNLAMLWDVDTGERLAELANVRPDSKIAVAADHMAVQDGSDRLTLVDVATGARLLALPVESLDDVVFDPSGRRLLIVEAPPGKTMTLRVVELDQAHITRR